MGSEEGGETFDMLVEVPSNHFVQQFGNALNNRRLEHIARVCADSSLTEKDVSADP